MIENEDNTFISIHHVGGRAGSRAFPFIENFEKDIINVLYDADVDCLEQIQLKNESKKSKNLYVLPFCLGASSKVAPFNINYDPYTSSLYRTNSAYNDFYYFNKNHDYIVGETFKNIEERELSVVTLDSIFQNKQCLAPPPDFLSIDVQGAEYDVLEGAKQTLSSSVLGLVLEVEFHSIYKGQKLFEDIVSMLRNQGFMFVKFLHMGELSPCRGAIGQRGDGIQSYADALFLLDINKINNKVSDPKKLYVMLRKLAYMSFVFNQFELGMYYLESAKKLKLTDFVAMKDRTYDVFLDDLSTELEQMPKKFPISFMDKYTFEDSKNRFNEDRRNLIPGKGLSYSIDLLKDLETDEFLNVERILFEYGLKEQAILIRSKRQEHVRGIMQEESRVSVNRKEIYFAELLKWHKLRSRGASIVGFLKDKNIQNLTIYGAGEVGQIVLNEIKNNIVVNFFIDNNFADSKLLDIAIVKYNQNINFGEAIIIAVLHDMDIIIKRELESLSLNIPIFTLREILALAS